MAEEMRPWQHGIPIEELRAIREVFSTHDEGLVLGAFTAVKENRIAEWMRQGRLSVRTDRAGRPVAAAASHRASAARPVRDFSEALRGRVHPGDVVVERFACLPGSEEELVSLLKELTAGSECWASAWQERPGDRELMAALGLQEAAVKIKASSELIGVYASAGATVAAAEVSPADLLCLALLALSPDPRPLAAALAARPPAFEQHYSGYNKRGSWTAMALRSYGGDPAFIIKPAEMAKKWKAENPEKLAWGLEWTPAWEQYPEAQALVDQVPGEKERVRLMQLQPGGGELTRHADITDPDAGTAPGRTLRVHIPIVTNPGVRFEMWRLDGSREQASMAEGEAWYLDTRKPHRAWNGGSEPRVHLVMDCFSSPELLLRLGV